MSENGFVLTDEQFTEWGEEVIRRLTVEEADDEDCLMAADKHLGSVISDRSRGRVDEETARDAIGAIAALARFLHLRGVMAAGEETSNG